jgi:hypothetical protein
MLQGDAAGGDWDSQLEATKSQVNNSMLSGINSDYRQMLNQLPPNFDKVLAKQLFAMNHKINPNVLKTATKNKIVSQISEINTPTRNYPEQTDVNSRQGTC